MWRLSGAHIFRTLNVRMSAEMSAVCLFAFMQAGAVCFFLYLFVYPPIKLHHLSFYADGKPIL